jgi:hypothetical protein
LNKHKTTCTNLASYLYYIIPLVCAQCQDEAIHFDLNSAFGLAPHSVLLHKLSAYVFSDGYVAGCVVT